MLMSLWKSGSDAFTDIFMNSGAPDYKFVADWDMIEAFPGLSSESNDNGSKLLVAFDYNKASRISGVSPADISVLLVYLESR